MSRHVGQLVAGLVCLGVSACAASTGSPEPAATSAAEVQVDRDEFRRFAIGGAEVWTRSALVDIPQSASTIQLSTMLIDGGNGPELCWPGVLDSDPPQCSGPVVNGLSEAWWSNRAEGVTWGDLTVTVTWPPAHGAVELVDTSPPTKQSWPDHPTRLELPRQCTNIEKFVDYQTLRDWEDANPDRNAQVRVVEDGTIAVIAVDGDIDAVRVELTDGDLHPCVVPVGYSRAALQAAQDDVSGLLGADVYVASIGGGYAYDRVTVELLVADRESVQRVVEAVDHPDILLITGLATIVTGN